MYKEYTDEQYDELEREEHRLTMDEIMAMILMLSLTKKNIKQELMDFYRKYGKDGVVTYQQARKVVSLTDRRKRLNALQYKLNDEFYELASDLKESFESYLLDIIDKEMDFFGVELSDSTDILDTNWGIDNLTYSRRIDDDVLWWKTHIVNDIKQSLLRQDNIDDLLARIDRRFTTMEHVIQRLGLTEATAIGSITRRAIFKELGISKYRFYARDDERTCEKCGSMHGLTFPMTAYEVGVTASPLHAHCRCWEVPIN